MNRINKYKWEMIWLVVGIILTFIARDYAVTQRLAMGLTPGWGGEFFIIPLMIVWYSILKADWSV